MRSFALLLVAASTFCLSAIAQDLPAIQTVRSAPGFRAAAVERFNSYESGLSTRCMTVSPDWSRASKKIYGQPQAAKDGGLVNATWVETVPGTACGQSRRYRVLVLIRGGHASLAPLLPGESFASPQLEEDSRGPMAKAVEGFVPAGQKCAVDVLDTRLVNGPPAAGKQPWDEVWTVGVCGKRLNVPVTFQPDVVGEGTSIHISSKDVTALP